KETVKPEIILKDEVVPSSSIKIEISKTVKKIGIGQNTSSKNLQVEENKPNDEKVVEVPKKTEGINVEPEAEDSGWNRLFLAISILIIAAGVSICGYYGYQWWMLKNEQE